MTRCICDQKTVLAEIQPNDMNQLTSSGNFEGRAKLALADAQHRLAEYDRQDGPLKVHLLPEGPALVSN
jgi:hypothetical protein